MRNEIIEHIHQLEVEQGITILLSVESGSRAWGCPSPDSDFDVRMIYKRSTPDYLEIDEKPDTINYFHGELLDINGWDIKKTLKLVRKSNVTPFEWAQSPMIYKEEDGFSSKLLEVCRAYFSEKHAVNHYKGIAKNCYSSTDFGKSINLKKLFYVLRPLMAAKWIIEKKEIPPMDIPRLIQIVKDQSVEQHIKELLAIKSNANEDYVHEASDLITEFIKEEFENINKTQLDDVPKDLNSEKLNHLFKEIIGS